MKSKLSCWRFIAQFWPLLAIFLLAQWLMRTSGNIASIAIPWWLSLTDSFVFTVAFAATAYWIHQPIHRALRHLNTSSPRSMHYLEHTVTLLPKRALNAFLVAGLSCACYLIAVLSIGTMISHSDLTPRMLLSLALSLLYGVGLLAPAVALTMTLNYAARVRQFLSEKGLFLHHFQNEEHLLSWSKVSKRPWVIFLITSAIPVSILALFVYLILGTDTVSERHFILLQAGILCISLLLAGTWLTFIVGRVVQRMMRTLMEALQRLQRGEFDQPAPILMDDEFGILSRGINTAFTGLKEREDIKQNLAIATEIHQAMLPQQVPELSDYHLEAFQQSCQSVGGDYYDYIRLNDGRIWLVVADVSGKGYPAALTVTDLRAMMHALAHLNISLPDAAHYINQSLCETLTGGRFITLFMASLDPNTHAIEWINAGHLPVLCCHQGNIRKLAASAPPMGLQETPQFHSQSITLAPDEIMLAYSDGVTESKHKERGTLWGDAALEDWLIQHEQHPNKIRALKKALNQWGNIAADDDVTMLFVQRKGVSI